MKSVPISFDVVAIFLILAEPFVELVYTNGFIFELVNVIILAGYAAATCVIALLLNRYPNRLFRTLTLTLLLGLFLDVRASIFEEPAYLPPLAFAGSFIAVWLFHLNASRVLIVVFGVIFVFTFSLPVMPQVVENPAAERPAPAPAALPTYIHIVLDEYSGVETLDERIDNQRELKRATKSLFVENGFRLFGRAYSEYFDTRDSVAAMLNAYSGEQPQKFYTYRNEAYNTVTRNNYLDAIVDAGYSMYIYQTSFLDLCSVVASAVRRCLTYSPFLGMTSEALQQLDWHEKLTLVWSVLWRRSLISKKISDVFRRAPATTPPDGELATHYQGQGFVGLGPIPTLQIFDRLISDVASAPKGTMFFAHLLIPHNPYSVEPDCAIRRPVVDWKLTGLPSLLGDGRSNTEHSRAARYHDYVDQAHCALKKVGELITSMKSAGIYNDAIIIIHGDHGSKISQFRPRKYFQDKLCIQDFYDGFSTLFAVKAPEIEPGYDRKMLPLQRLLQYAAGDRPEPLEEPADHVVYLRDESLESTFVKVLMPVLSGGTDTLRLSN